MLDEPFFRPLLLAAIERDALAAGFVMSCEPRTGSLLATLAASKPGGRFLELGTGAGAGASWLLHGMDQSATLVTVEYDAATQALAKRHLDCDRRVSFQLADAQEFLQSYNGPSFDFAFVDCRPGKFQGLADLLAHLTVGAIYVGDDLLPQVTWPEDHQQRVDGFLSRLPNVTELLATPMAWASGLVVGTRVNASRG